MMYQINLKPLISIFTLVMVIFLPMSAFASVDEDYPAGSPHRMVYDLKVRVFKEFRVKQKVYAEHPEILIHEINSVLDDYVDIRGIAMLVMGKHGKVSTKDDRDHFAKVFRETIESLIHTYSSRLADIDLDAIKIDIRPMSPDDIHGNKGKVIIDVVTAKGMKINISLRLSKSKKDNKWRVINVVAQGINLGKTARNYFDELVVEHGSIKKAIDLGAELVKEKIKERVDEADKAEIEVETEK